MILVGLVALSSAGCAAPSDAEPSASTNDPLVDGVESIRTGDGVVGLLVDVYDGKSHGACTGTLIGDNVVLTAAHCVVNKDSGKVTNAIVFDGTSYAARTWQETVSATAAVVYPGYDVQASIDFDKPDGWQNDLAILVLPATAPVRIQRAPMPGSDASELYATGSTVRLTGYGVTSLGGADGGVKRTGNAPILASLGKFVVLAKPEGRTSACKGDSGGPIRARTAQAPVLGVASFVHGDTKSGVALCQGESVYMRVSAYRGFIDSVVAANARR